MQAVFVQHDQARRLDGLVIDKFVIWIVALMINAQIKRALGMQSFKVHHVAHIIFIQPAILPQLALVFNKDGNVCRFRQIWQQLRIVIGDAGFAGRKWCEIGETHGGFEI